MNEDATNTVLLICDVWDNHYCADLRKKTESLARRINSFASEVRSCGGKVLHCPSDTVNTYYQEYPQRKVMLDYPKAEITVSEKMRSIYLPLDTTHTTGCPCIPLCRVHTEFTKQHGGIEIHPEDLISDNGQEIYNFLTSESISHVLMAGTALNMCVLGRSFGVESLSELGLNVSIMGDLVEVFYSPAEPPYITNEQAKWFALGYIESRWGCPATTCYNEIRELQNERQGANMRIHTNIPGPLISQLKKKWGLEYFVETGTAYGDATELASLIFEKVWSCEIDAKLAQKSRDRVAEYTNINIASGLSQAYLQLIKLSLTKPTLFWLDAHWCGGPVKPDKECPLLEELDAIGTFFSSEKPSVILIDDINLIENPPKPPHDPKQWPTMEQLRETLDKWKEPYDFAWYFGPTSTVLAVTLRNV